MHVYTIVKDHPQPTEYYYVCLDKNPKGTYPKRTDFLILNFDVVDGFRYKWVDNIKFISQVRSR